MMGKYSIKELEQLSGIKAHTIRIWEKRYHVVIPRRTATNIRYYSDMDLKRVLNMSILNSLGYKISKIASLSNQELYSKVAELTTEETDMNILVDEFAACMLDLDEVMFDKLLSSYILRFGFEKTILEIVYPFLEKVGILWLSDRISPIQEHFISNLIKQKIIVAIDALPLNTNSGAETVLLFLPENEFHEIGLLFYYYLLKKLRFRTIYLGQSVPLNDLEGVVNALIPKYLVTSITYNPRGKQLEEFIALMSAKFHTSIIYLTGKSVFNRNLSLPKNTHIFENAGDLKNIFMSEQEPS